MRRSNLTQAQEAQFRELVIAQGQENSARKDLTFIEKANFARQMREAGYDRKVICDALHVDKTQVSRMLAVADALPLSLIEAIGAAPAVGRNRWLDLARLLTDSDTRVEDAIALVHLSGADLSDARFEALMRALTLPRRRAQGDDGTGAVEIILRSAAGVEVGRLTRRRGRMTLTIPLANAEGFDAWLEANFQKLHRDWLASRRAEVAAAAACPDQAADKAARKADRAQAAADRQARLAARRPLVKELEQIDKRMAAWNKEKAEIDARLADPALYTGPQAGEVPALNKRQAELAERIEEAELRWLELHEALEAIPAD